MPTAKIYAAASAMVSPDQPNAHFSSGQTYISGDNNYYLPLKFDAPPESIKYKKLGTQHSLQIYVTSMSDYMDSARHGFHILSTSFDENTVTYNTLITAGLRISGYVYSDTIQQYNSIPVTDRSPKYLLIYGLRYSSVSATVYTDKGAYKPYMEIEYEDTTVGLEPKTITPANGSYSPKNKAISITWSAQATGDCLGEIIQTGCTVQYRLNDTSTIKTVTGTTQTSLEIPASAVTGAQIQYRVTLTASSGVQMTSDWITLSTTEAAGDAKAVSPKNATLDGSKANLFSWEHIIPTGTAQTAFDLQTSSNGTTWTTLLSGTTAETSAVIPANTLTGGDLYWRVRTYNTDGVAGEWSEPAHCIVVAAPAAPLVSIVDSAPRFAIRWQQAGQQGFEIMLDGKLIAKRFGATSSYQYDGYLDSGSHVVQVRIQNQYGLWSAWGAASLTIANVSGAEIALSVEADNTITLQWSTADAYHAYLIYRDGLLIGQTPNTSFKDNFALGDVSYQVRGIYDDTGYYTLSNVAAVSVRVSALMISPIKSPSWQRIPLSTSSLRSRTHSATQAVSYLHYTGSALPSAEIGEALDKTYRFDAAFLRANRAAAEAFESLIGQLVCIKDPDGYRVIGVLGTYSMTATPFYKSYSCTVTLVNWWEGADL